MEEHTSFKTTIITDSVLFCGATAADVDNDSLNVPMCPTSRKTHSAFLDFDLVDQYFVSVFDMIKSLLKQ